MSANANRRAVFLAEMGVGPLWIHRASEPVIAPADTVLAVETVEVISSMPTVVPSRSAPEQLRPALRQPDVERGAVTQSIAAKILPQQPVASAWDDDVKGQPLPRTARPAPVVAADGDIGAMDWNQLKTTVANCTKCDLCHGRTRTVFGVGDQKAKWLFVGEGPGRNEDVQGEPFVGPAGKLLDNMLLAIGVKRGENAYIANIVKCRPTDANGRDRPPTADEAATCMPYLERQIALIQPTIIVALGKTAALSLLKLDPATPVSKLRGTVHRFAELPLIVTYHPAYLLRSLTEKRKAWEDLCLAMNTYSSAA